MVFLDFRYINPFRNASNSKGSALKIEVQFLTFWPTPVKLGKGLAKYLSQFFKFNPGSNNQSLVFFWWELAARAGRLTVKNLNSTFSVVRHPGFDLTHFTTSANPYCTSVLNISKIGQSLAELLMIQQAFLARFSDGPMNPLFSENRPVISPHKPSQCTF